MSTMTFGLQKYVNVNTLLTFTKPWCLEYYHYYIYITSTVRIPLTEAWPTASNSTHVVPQYLHNKTTPTNLINSIPITVHHLSVNAINKSPWAWPVTWLLCIPTTGHWSKSENMLVNNSHISWIYIYRNWWENLEREREREKIHLHSTSQLVNIWWCIYINQQFNNWTMRKQRELFPIENKAVRRRTDLSVAFLGT